MVTSVDVAKLAKVSRATVSAVINRNRYVSKELEKRVLNAIKKLNYKPNAIARSLKTKYTKTIGLVIPNIGSPFFSFLVEGIESFSNKNGYNIILCNSDENSEKERDILDVLLGKSVDGLIMIPTGSKNKDYIFKNVIKSKKPIVFLDREINGIEADVVVSENIVGAYETTNFLFKNGYKNIAIITHSEDITPGKKRLEGYIKSLKENKIEIKEEYIKSGGFSSKEGYLNCEDIFRESKIKPDSIIVASSHLELIGVLNYLDDHNIKIPKDIGLIGFDDLPWVRYLNPPLTVNTVPMFEMGNKAAELVIDKIESKKHYNNKPNKISFKRKLIIRNSTNIIY
ncbi:MAG: LacI family transcriptional regulator [Actinobacteria bacterium]|nr:LacI family transcriptional regulator [Actinomycetota bacterium]